MRRTEGTKNEKKEQNKTKKVEKKKIRNVEEREQSANSPNPHNPKTQISVALWLPCPVKGSTYYNARKKKRLQKKSSARCGASYNKEDIHPTHTRRKELGLLRGP